MTSIETREEAKASKQLPLLREYKSKIEGELNKFCNDILDLLDKKLIPGSEGDKEANVFYLKMKGDYYRYISEYASGDLHTKASENALQAYELATNVANANSTSLL